MAHPYRDDVAASHTAKMRKMTDRYGLASGPEDNITAPSERLKGEAGGEPHIGFGINSDAPRTRADRAQRKTTAANPIATYKHGGAVKGKGKHHRADGGPTGSSPAVSPIEEANMDQSVASRARGGRTKAKHGTHVSVIVAPQGGGMGGAGLPGGMPIVPPRPVPPVIPPAAPPGMPPGAPPGMPPGAMGARPPIPPGMPGGVMPPPGAIRAHGGRVKHADEAEDKALIKKELRAQGLIRADHEVKRAHGGRLPNQKHHMEAGAATGLGRLEKIGEKPKSAGRPQAV